MLNIRVPDGLLAVHRAIAAAGGRPLLVGGCVRDALLGVEPSDFDTEAFGLVPDELESVLRRLGTVNLVGRSFGVFKLRTRGSEFDVSVPRRDNKAGSGHRGFVAHCDPTMTPAEAAARRDFTINAISYDALAGELIDPAGGRYDLRCRVLRPVSPRAFAEDPLRLLRGMQLAARFRLAASPEMAGVGVPLLREYDDLARERIWGEWRKWSLSGDPGFGIAFLFLVGWGSLYPEIDDLRTCEQDPKWHPEGTAYSHTLYVCDAAARIADRDGLSAEDRSALVLAALCHDMGKPATTVFERGKWRSPGHAEAGVPVAAGFLDDVGCPAGLHDRVLTLVREHMYPTWEPTSRRAVRRLKQRLAPVTIAELLRVVEADHSGRPPLPAGLPEGAGRLLEYDVELPPTIEPLLLGRHLIAEGVPPGPAMGAILKSAFEAQLDEEFLDLDGAIAWFRAGAHLQESR